MWATSPSLKHAAAAAAAVSVVLCCAMTCPMAWHSLGHVMSLKHSLCLLCVAAGSDSGTLKAIKAAGSAAPTLEFGAIQTQQAGAGADIRRKFAGH